MSPPDEPPQWVKSRLKAVRQLPDCRTTHYACRCFLEKIVQLEAELARLRGDPQEEA